MRRIDSMIGIQVALWALLVPGASHATSAEKQLWISSPEVIEALDDKGNGPLSFTDVVENLVPHGGKVETWIRAWVKEWDKDKDPNGLSIKPRDSQLLLTKFWPMGHGGGPDWNKSPFRLVSVVFRLDARTMAKPAGEGRLIYVLQDPMKTLPEDYLVIFEYRLPTEKWKLADWVKDIDRLGQIGDGAKYRRALRDLTLRFVGEPKALLAVRTNELVFGDPWELRNFERDPMTGLPVELETGQTPHLDFNGEHKAGLVKWIEANEAAVMDNTHVLPISFQTSAALMPDEFFKWLADTGLHEPVRKAFSAQTCNGCHSADTGTRFQHVTPGAAGTAPMLSEFLRGALVERVLDFDKLLQSSNAPPPKLFDHRN